MSRYTAPKFTMNSSNLKGDVQPLSVTIPKSIVDKLFEHVVHEQHEYISPQGLKHKNLASSYISDRFKESFLEHVKELLFKFHARSLLYKNLRKQKILSCGTPRLDDISLNSEGEVNFDFLVTSPPKIDIDEWKYVVFKSPQRKFYKDLDKQAELFARNESQKESKCESNAVGINDWICFDIWLADAKNKPVVGPLKETLWLKIGEGEAYKAYQDVFLGKNVDDKIFTKNLCFQEFFSETIDTDYNFGIKLTKIVPSEFFSIPMFQEYFKIKTKKKAQQKLIEVFSYRNDISLRRATVEDLFSLMLRKHYVPAPQAPVLRHQQYILDELQENADYPVYKTQKNFQEYLHQLAEKQIKEKLLIDQVAFNENILCDNDDLGRYLNLTQRLRTKEFIYFEHPSLKANALEYPISYEELMNDCLREKTLNHMISYLAAH